MHERHSFPFLSREPVQPRSALVLHIAVRKGRKNTSYRFAQLLKMGSIIQIVELDAVWPIIEASACAGGILFYNQVVPLPMSLLIIQARLENNYYRHRQAVRTDAELIASNADVFNGSRSAIAKAGRGEALAETSSVS